MTVDRLTADMDDLSMGLIADKGDTLGSRVELLTIFDGVGDPFGSLIVFLLVRGDKFRVTVLRFVLHWTWERK